MSDRMLRMAGSEIAGELAGLLLEQSCLFGVFSLGFCFNDLLLIVDNDGMAGLNEVHNWGMYTCKLIDHTHCSPVQCFSLLNQTLYFFGPRLQTKGTYRFTLVRPSVEYIIDYYSIP